MRIALLTGCLSHRGYGVRNAVEILSADLMRLGHDVMVFGLADHAWVESESLMWRGAPTHVLRFFGPENFGYAPGLANDVVSFDPDIVHVNGLWMYHSAVAPKVAKRSGAKLIVSPHGMMASAALHYSSFKKRAALAIYQRACFEAADGFHATAHSEREEIKSLTSDPRIMVIPNGLRITGLVGLPMQARKNRVIAIGRLHHKKAYDQLLRAWKLIEGRFPNWTLEIRGPSTDNHADQLAKLATELGLARAVVGGPVDENERDRLLGDSKLFVLSSHNENFALTVPEALYLGTPVLASKGTPWAGLDAHGCGWWVEGDPESLADGLSQALSVDDGARGQMGQQGRKWVQDEFSAERAARSMAEFYTSLIAGGKT